MIGRAALAAVAAALFAPAGASASTLSVDAARVAQYDAAPGEVTHLVVSFDYMHGVYLFNDTGATAISVTGGTCHVASAQLAYCPLGSLSSVAAHAGAGGSYAQSQLSLTPVTLTGGSGTSTLVGGNSATTFVAGSGQTTITGGNGSDTVDSRNGASDQVTCGGGTDRVAADPQDSVAADCEQVDRGTAPSGGSGSGDPGPGSGPIAPGVPPIAQILPTPVAITPSNTLPIGVSCPAGLAGGCQVTLTVTIYVGVRAHRAGASRRRKVVLRSRPEFVAPGKSASVRVPLDRRAVRVFRSRGRTRRFKATVTLSMQTEAGMRTTSRTLTLRAARRHAVRKHAKKRSARRR